MKILKLNPEAKIPTKANPGDLGYDLYANESLSVHPGVNVIHTGIAIAFDEGWGGVIKDRSSMALRGTSVVGGVIDNGYRGEIIVLLRGYGEGSLYIGKGQKIAQLIPVQVANFEIEEVEHLFETIRGGKGFGSSGA